MATDRIFCHTHTHTTSNRRAEAEADLIGLKLMALAGYDPALAPQTFRCVCVCVCVPGGVWVWGMCEGGGAVFGQRRVGRGGGPKV